MCVPDRYGVGAKAQMERPRPGEREGKGARQRERERERETELFFYNTRIEVKAQMPVKQPVLDTNYKHLKRERERNPLRKFL